MGGSCHDNNRSEYWFKGNGRLSCASGSTIDSRVESVSIVGLPDTSVKESKERVMAALYAYDITLPDQKIVVHLSPAEERKNSDE